MKFRIVKRGLVDLYRVQFKPWWSPIWITYGDAFGWEAAVVVMEFRSYEEAKRFLDKRMAQYKSLRERNKLFVVEEHVYKENV